MDRTHSLSAFPGKPDAAAINAPLARKNPPIFGIGSRHPGPVAKIASVVWHGQGTGSPTVSNSRARINFDFRWRAGLPPPGRSIHAHLIRAAADSAQMRGHDRVVAGR